jgi:peptidoglycan hydrolase-like protein with peptidoglycan-binding domain
MLRTLVDTPESEPEAVEGPCPDTVITAADRPRLLIRGAVHAAVRDAQRRLNAFSRGEVAAGRAAVADPPLREDCIFGAGTQRAVIAFQQRAFPGQADEHDGKLGRNTWAQLDRVAGAAPPAPAPAPAAQGCSDADIAAALGIRADTSRDGLFGFDSQFAGASGTAFRDRIRTIAQDVGLDPGLLAANLLAEIQNRATWMSTGSIESPQVGVDYWHEERPKIRAAVPATRRIRDSMITDSAGQPVHFFNEVGNDTGPKYRFTAGKDGMLALAGALAWREIRLRNAFGTGVYDAAPAAVRFAALRLSFNPSFARGKAMIETSSKGGDPLIRSGPGGTGKPTRAATIRAGQALHLSQSVFGNAFGCP